MFRITAEEKRFILRRRQAKASKPPLIRDKDIINAAKRDYPGIELPKPGNNYFLDQMADIISDANDGEPKEYGDMNRTELLVYIVRELYDDEPDYVWPKNIARMSRVDIISEIDNLFEY